MADLGMALSALSAELVSTVYVKSGAGAARQEVSVGVTLVKSRSTERKSKRPKPSNTQLNTYYRTFGYSARIAAKWRLDKAVTYFSSGP